MKKDNFKPKACWAPVEEKLPTNTNDTFLIAKSERTPRCVFYENNKWYSSFDGREVVPRKNSFWLEIKY